MALRKVTVLVDEDDLAIIKQASAQSGRPESQYFPEAFHIAAIRAQRHTVEEWNVPSILLPDDL